MSLSNEYLQAQWNQCQAYCHDTIFHWLNSIIKEKYDLYIDGLEQPPFISTSNFYISLWEAKINHDILLDEVKAVNMFEFITKYPEVHPVVDRVNVYMSKMYNQTFGAYFSTLEEMHRHEASEVIREKLVKVKKFLEGLCIAQNMIDGVYTFAAENKHLLYIAMLKTQLEDMGKSTNGILVGISRYTTFVEKLRFFIKILKDRKEAMILEEDEQKKKDEELFTYVKNMRSIVATDVETFQQTAPIELLEACAKLSKIFQNSLNKLLRKYEDDSANIDIVKHHENCTKLLEMLKHQFLKVWQGITDEKDKIKQEIARLELDKKKIEEYEIVRKYTERVLQEIENDNRTDILKYYLVFKKKRELS